MKFLHTFSKFLLALCILQFIQACGPEDQLEHRLGRHKEHNFQPSELKLLKLTIDNMTCEKCKNALESTLINLEGVVWAYANLNASSGTENLMVRHAFKHTSKDQIIDAIENNSFKKFKIISGK